MKRRVGRLVRNLKMQGEQGLPPRDLSGLEYLFILLSAAFVAPGAHAVISWSRFRHFFLPMARASRLMLPSRCRLSLFLMLGTFLLPLGAVAQTAPGEEALGEPIRREILAIYDSRDEPRPDQTRIHRFAEMPLNHLGFVLSYWDVNAGMPTAERAARVRGVITWFRRAPPSAFYLWGLDLLQRGGRIVVLGDSGLPSANMSLADANRMFQEIGFGFTGTVVDITYATKVLHRDSLIGFERDLDPVLPAFPIVGALGQDVSSDLVLEHREGDLVLASSIVLTSKHGGYAANGYFVYEEPLTGRTKWIVDPFAFFQRAFGAGRMPIPDPTTLSGRRLWFSHIDGDGWNNVSYIEQYRDKPTVAAGVLLRELIVPYPDLPVAVGVIGADIDERYGTPEAGRQAARELFALPQVEIASHTYSHPYQWSFFENYDRKLEERLIGPDESKWKAVVGDRLRRIAQKIFPGWLHRGSESDIKVAGDDPPRAYSDFPFDLDQEIRGSVVAAEELAPESKHATLYLWSGGAEPFQAAIAATRRLGLRNLNGGDSRFDPDFPSISYLSPLSRVAGSERQIYAADANDYIFITDGGGREHGFLNLDATIKQTESPRRLKPIDIYYHMYAGERPAQLAAVRHHLDAARQAEVTPVFASHYAAIADGFFSAEITSLGDKSWLITHRGALQTVRFDDAKGLVIDFDRSVGVIGQRRNGTALYVGLDEAFDQIIVALRDEPGPAPAVKPLPTQSGMSDIFRRSLRTADGALRHAAEDVAPYLIEGRWTFRDMRRQDCGFTVMAKGFGIGQMTWGGLRPGLYHAYARDTNHQTVWEDELEAGDDRRLALTADADASSPLEIELACVDKEP
jgi:polysaccharide biosynthesis protein PelA